VGAIFVALKERGIANFGIFEDESQTKHCTVEDRYKALCIVNNKVA